MWLTLEVSYLYNMKYIITEDQLKKVKKKILTLPFVAFNNDWNLLQEFLELRNFPPYILKGDVNLRYSNDITSLGSLIEVEGSLYLFDSSIKDLGNLTSVSNNLNLYGTSIESLRNLTYVGGYLHLAKTLIESLGNLKSVGSNLDLGGIPIFKDLGDLTHVGGDLDLYNTGIESLGNLKFVSGSLDINKTPVSKIYSEEQIRDVVDVGGSIYYS